MSTGCRPLQKTHKHYDDYRSAIVEKDKKLYSLVTLAITDKPCLRCQSRIINIV